MSIGTFYSLLPDRLYIKLRYWHRFGKRLNLRDPRTFNEKIQWLKLYDRKDIYTVMVDKVLVKDYVAAIIGKEYIIPTLGVWDSPEEIDFDQLPNQFVIKCNHNSGTGMYICKDKSKMNIDQVKAGLAKGLKENYYRTNKEWPYKNVKRKILAEAYLSDGTDSLSDFKVHNFNSIPKIVLVCKNRFEEGGMTEDFFTANWEHIDVSRISHPNSTTTIEQPAELAEMLLLSEKLAKDMPFLRTDFYIVNNKIYFGELTLFPASGFEGFRPEMFDQYFGDWIHLPIEGGGDTN